MTTQTKVLDAACAAIVATMLGGIESEANVRDDVTSRLDAASLTAWSICRDAVIGLLSGDLDMAGLVLDDVRDTCKEARKTRQTMGRGVQYAADLRRAITLKKAGVELPEELKTATRSAWNDAAVWAEAGILKASGKAKGSKAAKPEGEEGEEGEAVSDAVKPDAALSGLMAIVGQLRGPFRAEWLKEAEMAAVSILAKQAAATGSGSAAAAVVAKPEAKPEARKGKGRKAA